jgi:hypothetical protein
MAGSSCSRSARRVSKTWLLGDIAWAVVSPVTTVSTPEDWARATPA